MEFNPDGSLKIPGNYAKPVKRLNIRKDIVSEYAPKSCSLKITGDMAAAKRALSGIECDTPIKTREFENEIEVTIGSDFKRCSDCKSIVFRLSSIVQGDCHTDNGTCPAKGSQQNFCYEDYFSE